MLHPSMDARRRHGEERLSLLEAEKRARAIVFAMARAFHA